MPIIFCFFTRESNFDWLFPRSFFLLSKLYLISLGQYLSIEQHLLYLHVCNVSVYPSICLEHYYISIYPSIYPSIYLSIHLSIYLLILGQYLPRHMLMPNTRPSINFLDAAEHLYNRPLPLLLFAIRSLVQGT